MADFAQFIVRQPPFQFVIQLLPLFCLDGKLTQVPDMAAYTTRTPIERDAEQGREQ